MHKMHIQTRNIYVYGCFSVNIYSYKIKSFLHNWNDYYHFFLLQNTCQFNFETIDTIINHKNYSIFKKQILYNLKHLNREKK